MKIDISNIHDFLQMDEKISIDRTKLSNTGILELQDVKIKGLIYKNNIEDYEIDCEVSGVMVLSDSITNEPINHKFNIKINGDIFELLQEIGKNFKKTEKTIDIFPIIWENILLEVPLKIVNFEFQNRELKGKGWEFVTEDKKEINPALSKLKDLL